MQFGKICRVFVQVCKGSHVFVQVGKGCCVQVSKGCCGLVRNLMYLCRLVRDVLVCFV